MVTLSDAMVTLSDGTAMPLADYKRIFSSSAANSPEIERKELALYVKRVETDRLTRLVTGSATQAGDTTQATRATTGDATRITVPGDAGNVATVSVRDGIVSASVNGAEQQGAGKGRLRRRRITAERPMEFDPADAMPRPTDDATDARMEFEPGDAVQPIERDTFSYTPPKSLEDAYAALPITLPVLDAEDGFVSDVAIIRAETGGRYRHRR